MIGLLIVLGLITCTIGIGWEFNRPLIGTGLICFGAAILWAL